MSNKYLVNKVDELWGKAKFSEEQTKDGKVLVAKIGMLCVQAKTQAQLRERFEKLVAQRDYLDKEFDKEFGKKETMDIKVKHTITITINGKTEEISEKQAKELYEQLYGIFGQRNDPSPVPYYPPPIEPFDYPSTPWVPNWPYKNPPVWCRVPETVCQSKNTVS